MAEAVVNQDTEIMAGDIMVDGALQEKITASMTTATMLQQSATA